MFEQTFKNIDDILHKDAGCGSELDYEEQTSCLLFLKYQEGLEKDKALAAELSGKTYTNIIEPEYQFSVWATHMDAKKTLDHHKALSADVLAEPFGVFEAKREEIGHKLNIQEKQSEGYATAHSRH